MIRYFITACAVITLTAFLLSGELTGLDKVSAAKAGMQTPADQSAKQFNQEQAIAELKKKIAGQENKPAEEVFKNIQLLKGVPAARVLGIMVVGYSKSLGVDCTHCHTPDQWEKDDLQTKQVTRDMAMMVRAINNEHLKKIKGLKSENPVVNCTTCHRGQTKPALNLP